MSALAGKVAVVTGASKGIGAGIAKELAAQGASVVVNYSSSKAGADAVVADIAARGGSAVALKANLAEPAEIAPMFAAVKQKFGRLDILVNNAGIYEFASLLEITPEHFHRQFNVNVLGLLLASREAAKLFGPEGGSIINISSVGTSAAPPMTAVYSGTKGAVDVITRTLANELGPRGIRVNSVNPGMVETEGTQAMQLSDAEGAMRKDFESKASLGRIGLPRDVAPAVAFLASDGASWITGEVLNVAGGFR
jgi:3-oxoacyl-[acyl-carrier protein] reductase